jgi:hypothetical protein
MLRHRIGPGQPLEPEHERNLRGLLRRWRAECGAPPQTALKEKPPGPMVSERPDLPHLTAGLQCDLTSCASVEDARRRVKLRDDASEV